MDHCVLGLHAKRLSLTVSLSNVSADQQRRVSCLSNNNLPAQLVLHVFDGSWLDGRATILLLNAEEVIPQRTTWFIEPTRCSFIDVIQFIHALQLSDLPRRASIPTQRELHAECTDHRPERVPHETVSFLLFVNRFTIGVRKRISVAKLGWIENDGLCPKGVLCRVGSEGCCSRVVGSVRAWNVCTDKEGTG